MNLLKIALLQIAPCGSLTENIEKGIGNCKKAKALGADIALFPEMWSNGYNMENRAFDELMTEAVTADGEYAKAFSETARELEMAVAVTLLENYGDRKSVV